MSRGESFDKGSLQNGALFVKRALQYKGLNAQYSRSCLLRGGGEVVVEEKEISHRKNTVIIVVGAGPFSSLY